MIDFRYDNDLVFVNGDLDTVDKDKAAGQRIRDRLLTFQGEWFMDLNYGPDYRGEILKKNPRLNIVTAILRNEILKSQDGTFREFSVSSDTSRKVTISYILDTLDTTISDTVTI